MNSLLFLVSGLTLFMTSDNSLLEKLRYDSTAHKTLPYRFLKPAQIEQGKKYPLVIFLHGAGERGTDNEAQLKHGISNFTSKENREKHPCFLIAPQCPEARKWVEVDWSARTHLMPAEPSEPMGALLELIEKTMKDYPIDPERVYVTGLSMGGYGTWDLMARRPKLIAAAIPVCGGADEHTAEKIQHIPVWVFHGDQDTAVAPERSRNMVAALKKAGGSPKYTEYKGVGHDSWTATYNNADVMQWLFAQKNSPK